MTIYKNCKKEREFAQISNSLIGNPNLSAKAKGILIYLISKPVDWEVRFSDIKNHMKDGETAIRSGLKELEKAGYIKRGIERTDDGKFSEWIWNVYEEPISPENRTNPDDRKFKREKQKPRGIVTPDGENPKVDNPELDNHNPTNKDSTNTDYNNMDLKEGADAPDWKALAEESKANSKKYKERVAKSLEGFVNRQKSPLDNINDYPPEVQNVIKQFCKRWRIFPPPKGTSLYGKWIKDAKEVKRLIENTGLTAEVAMAEAYYDWKTPHEFSKMDRGQFGGKFTVTSLGSLTSYVWERCSAIVDGRAKRKTKTYTDQNGNKIEVDVD